MSLAIHKVIHSLDVAVNAPLHSGLNSVLSYAHERHLPAGSLVRVPLGARELLGVVWEPQSENTYQNAAFKLRPIASEVCPQLEPLSDAWRRLVTFSARYYQRSIGEISTMALPPLLRQNTPEQMERRLKKLSSRATPTDANGDNGNNGDFGSAPTLSAEQKAACERIESIEGKPFLLYGSTGSGKTEVYLHTAQELLERRPHAQVLVLVPEINLTPQLMSRFQERFNSRFGASAVVSLHSGLTSAQRMNNWLSAHTGAARIVLGTRMAIFASLPDLSLIIVDEEHDPSFKQEEGARYSARDLALWRGRDVGAKVILGSATPSLESWQACIDGRYQLLEMPSRISSAPLPRVRIVPMHQRPRGEWLCPELVEEIAQRVRRGEQSLVLLNRRGFATALLCNDCGWKSECPNCSAYQVLHKGEGRLRCHHCGASASVPRRCPSCHSGGGVGGSGGAIAPLGVGTEQLHDELKRQLQMVLPQIRIARIDSDSTRAPGRLNELLEEAHSGALDVLVGTQMLAKGHDFRRITLVAALEPDGALFSSDFRAPERLFALLMQAAGRAGRDARFLSEQGSEAQMWLQTRQPDHPLYQALQAHDYPRFAHQQLLERRAAGMPPFMFQALLRADAKTQEAAQEFLEVAAQSGRVLPQAQGVFIYSPIPLTIQRVANLERAQLLVEGQSRAGLQRFLRAWQSMLRDKFLMPSRVQRWFLDIDPA